jgi:hypothetical protein
MRSLVDKEAWQPGYGKGDNWFPFPVQINLEMRQDRERLLSFLHRLEHICRLHAIHTKHMKLEKRYTTGNGVMTRI